MGHSSARGVVEAPAAEVYLGLDLENRLGEAPRLLGIGLEQVVGDALGALGPDAGQPPELVEQLLQTLVGGHGRSPPAGLERHAGECRGRRARR